MKKIFFSIIFLVENIYAHSQNITVQQVNSDADVLAYVKQENYDKDNAPQWNHFYLTDGTEWKSYYNLSTQQVASVEENMQHTSWQKADVNGDGKPDLIVNGYIARRPKDWNTSTFKLLVFLSQRGNGYVELNLIDDQLDKFPSYFDVLPSDTVNYLKVYRWQPDADAALKLPLKIDTLRYHNMLDNFVNYSQYLYEKNIQKIDYLVKDFQPDTYKELSVEKLNEKYANVVISIMQPDSKTPSTFKARMTTALWGSVDSLMRSIPLRGDSTVYNSSIQDEKLPIVTTIYYTDGSKKIIKDYDGDVSFSLMTLYQTFETIIGRTLDEYQQRQQRISEFMDDMFSF
ncbi:hypothetical protein A9P82_01930 [Arachidicoccus ginsenosidimutans]|uniref:hypothetical protein n=1 Tax=Arachidicoccus sp. BS20 TaxID=1850526 RepID=UPI0007F0588D|nr:hypothetical protein [Arachidicoccus sp. BS20]ANI88178.1 hypothetical protein A9P82_01930 [Arachidicoccus sp. BS20]